MSNPRILVVDDEKAILESYRSVLRPKTESSRQEVESLGFQLFDNQSEGEISDEEQFFADSDEEMIIEDDLTFNQYELTEATQGQKAVDLVRHSIDEEKPFSLIFIDVRMPPGIDGVESARLIRAMDPDVEIVIMTAYSDYNFAEIVEKVGNPERLLYFNKPFTATQIAQLASSLTQKWSLTKKEKQQNDLFL